MAFEHELSETEEKLYAALLSRCKRIIGKQDLPRNAAQFETMVDHCSVFYMGDMLQEMFPEPMDSVVALKALISKGWVTETRDSQGYPAFVPSTHMAIEEVSLKRTRMPARC